MHYKSLGEKMADAICPKGYSFKVYFFCKTCDEIFDSHNRLKLSVDNFFRHSGHKNGNVGGICHRCYEKKEYQITEFFKILNFVIDEFEGGRGNSSSVEKIKGGLYSMSREGNCTDFFLQEFDALLSDLRDAYFNKRFEVSCRKRGSECDGTYGRCWEVFFPTREKAEAEISESKKSRFGTVILPSCGKFEIQEKTPPIFERYEA